MERRRVVPLGRVSAFYTYFEPYTAVTLCKAGQHQYLLIRNVSYFAESFLLEVLKTLESEVGCVTFKRGTDVHIVRSFCREQLGGEVWWLWALDRFCSLLCENDPHGQRGPLGWRLR